MKRFIISVLILGIYFLVKAQDGPALYIDSNEDVGIGTKNPEGKFHVNFGNKGQGIFEFNTGSTNYGEFAFREDGVDRWSFGAISSSPHDGRFYIFNYNTTKQVIVADVNGNIGIGNNNSPSADLDINNGSTFSRVDAGATQFTASSSRSLKRDIREFRIDDILERISKVPVSTYHWKTAFKSDQNDDRENVLGLIAEDFYTVLKRGDNKSINGQEVQMALWMGVQELYKYCQSLEDEIKALKGNDIDSNNVILKGDRANLGQNYPNPFNSETVIEYFVPKGSAEIQFFDMSGKFLKEIEINEVGQGKVNLRTQNLASGIYEYFLIVDGVKVDSKKMVLNK